MRVPKKNSKAKGSKREQLRSWTGGIFFEKRYDGSVGYEHGVKLPKPKIILT